MELFRFVGHPVGKFDDAVAVRDGKCRVSGAKETIPVADAVPDLVDHTEQLGLIA